MRADEQKLDMRRDYRWDELARNNEVHIHQIYSVRKLSSCALKVSGLTTGDLLGVCELEGKAIGAN